MEASTILRNNLLMQMGKSLLLAWLFVMMKNLIAMLPLVPSEFMKLTEDLVDPSGASPFEFLAVVEAVHVMNKVNARESFKQVLPSNVVLGCQEDVQSRTSVIIGWKYGQGRTKTMKAGGERQGKLPWSLQLK